MTQLPDNLPWAQPDWTAQAHRWIEQSLAQAGIPQAGPPETVHTRIWSLVMRVPTSAGTLYFKACNPIKEARLTVFLRAIQPENLPDLVAVDEARGWMLMRDAGDMLRAHLKTPADLAILEPALVQFANLQIAAAGQAGALLDLGAFDRRLERLPDMFEQILADRETLRIGEEDGLTEEQYRALQTLLPRYRDMCRDLQLYPVPQTLHHDDFHDGNIFVQGVNGSRRFIFSDWDESGVAHPFFSMMLCLRSVGGRAGFPDEATEAPDRMPPELNHLRDVYLRPWQVYTSAETLVKVFNLAWRVGMVSRAYTWREFVTRLDEGARKDFTYYVPAWLGEFLLAMK